MESISVEAKPEAMVSSGVSLVVTPELTVPTARLRKVLFSSRLDELARKDSPEGLVDEGGKAKSDVHLLAEGHYNGFISATCAAFANHYPLALRPQHFWLLILQQVAKHVETNADAVRSKWVAHEGKKELLVRRDGFVRGCANDWAGVVDGPPDSFSAQITQNVVEGVAEALSPAFSDTTPLERVCEKITVMDCTKSFFSFKCMTMCGFPSVTLEGTRDDWVALRQNAEALVSERCEPAWASSWQLCLLPLLDKIVDEYERGARGEKGDEEFWNSMCKRGGTSGSGSRTWFNGWFNIFFPYILSEPNAFMQPYAPTNGYVQEGRDGGNYGMRAPRDVQGPDVADFPTGVASAPVLWDYHGTEIKLQFNAGFVGATQDQASGTVRPALGWYVGHESAKQSVMDDPYAAMLRGGRHGRGRQRTPMAAGAVDVGDDDEEEDMPAMRARLQNLKS